MEETKEVEEVKGMSDKTKKTLRSIGLGVAIVGGIIAVVGGATLDELKNGAAIAFGLVEIVGAAIAFIFGA